jgi:hypothetical protein
VPILGVFHWTEKNEGEQRGVLVLLVQILCVFRLL